MFIYEEAHPAADVSARRRRDAGPAAARVDGAGADAAAADGRGAGASASSASGIRTARRRATGVPLQEGKDFEFSFITKPLEPFRNRTVLITGLDMPEAMATDDYLWDEQ